MPYIKPERREQLNTLKDDFPKSVGELNYCISKRIHRYFIDSQLNYTNLNRVIGILDTLKLFTGSYTCNYFNSKPTFCDALANDLHELISKYAQWSKYETNEDLTFDIRGVLKCAELELYRQIAAPYEDIKKEQNGPVSELDKEIV
jgi:hypothetical protein